MINILKDLFSIYRKKSILISSYPKCGSTYLRFFLLNYLLIAKGHKTSTDHEVLNEFLPELGQGKVGKAKFNKFVKTHHTVGFYKQSRVVRIIRNPYDSLCSAYEYYNRSSELDFHNINEFLRSRRGLKSYKAHFELFASCSGICICYENLIKNPKKQFRLLTEYLTNPQKPEVLGFIINSISRDKIVRSESRNLKKKTNNFSNIKSYGKYKKEIDKDLMIDIIDLDKQYQNIL